MKRISSFNLAMVSILFRRGLLLAAFPAALSAAEPTAAYKFSFAGGTPAAGYTPVAPDMVYSPERGYGFEPGANLTVAQGGKGGGTGAVTSAEPFYFSVALPEGNYKVTVTLGNPVVATNETVKAELRRLMLEKVPTQPGQFVTESFIVNTRVPEFPGGKVRLKAPRETTNEAWAWDQKLTLEFNGVVPSVAAVAIEKVNVPTMYVVGDSTVCDQSAEPYNSWGQMLPRWFKPEVAVANHGESGETVASALGEQRFAKVWSLMKPGDYLIFQFAHNDMKSNAPNALEKYKADYRQVIAETRKRGGFPIIVAAMERSNGVTSDTLKGYPAAAIEVAKEENVPYIDLHSMSQTFYQALGPDVKKAFADGVTHHNNYGSYELARAVVLGIKQNVPGLAKYITDDYVDFNPAKPDPMGSFVMATSPKHTNQRPLGDDAGPAPTAAATAVAPAATPTPSTAGQ